MNDKKLGAAIGLGIFICIGMIGLGVLLANGAMRVKSLNRTVTVKGLSEREASADVVIWPIKFSEADNDLSALYATIQSETNAVVSFLKARGFSAETISVSVPAIVDRQAQSYGGSDTSTFRYIATSTVTLYSSDVDKVRQTMTDVVALVKQGIAIAGQDYETKPEFLFTKLNELKPAMIEEATRNAREVAEKFAADSKSRLGKIKSARQGQFSIFSRDSNTPYIKKIRVVSTLEYYLDD